MKTKKIGLYVLGIYVVCFLLRIIEYFWLRTDQTIIGEAFIHKLLGILIIAIAMKKLNYKLSDIGIVKEKCLQNIVYGLVFGLAMFAIGYSVEIGILIHENNFKSINFYVSSYAVDKNIELGSGLIFLVVCIIGNIINVMMEEGLFRGLFQKMLMEKYLFVKAAIICSILFGLWHTIGPIRNYIDGISSLNGTIANILMLFFSSGLIAFKFALLSKMEGALYMGMADHFVNNTIVNLLHVTSTTGVDEMMFARISIAQSISFIIVLIIFIKRKKWRNDYEGVCKKSFA